MMRANCNHFLTLITFGSIAALVTIAPLGCSDEPKTMLTPPPPTGSCVPKENAGSVDGSCGVFVAASGDDMTNGSKETPVATLAKAITLAAGKGNAIYACAETFPEAVEVPAGVTIYGGLTCADKSWKHGGPGKVTTFAPEAGKVPLTLKKGAGTTHIEDVVAMAADATAPGGSSVAAIADSVTANFVRCDFIAGLGAAGEVGMKQADVMPSMPDDPAVAGNPGAVPCMGGATGNLGGAAKANPSCMMSTGGVGGTGLELSGDKGADGSPAPDPNPTMFGAGGAGALVATGCQAGQTGAIGMDGAPGTGGTGIGMVDAKGFIGVAGIAGSVGMPGQGGGGGGGAKGMIDCYGASGGSGGAGGCGGQGGLGGQPGGSSIALISLSATLTFTDVNITTSDGGAGGDGGDGQIGGVGGLGGKGGGQGMAGAACSGGDGGSGGKGGRGGGGVGGHSIGIAHREAAPPEKGATITTGKAGGGGLGEGAGMEGAAGMSANIQSFDAP